MFLKVKEKIRRNGFSSGKPFLLLGPRNKANYAVIRLSCRNPTEKGEEGVEEMGEREKKNYIGKRKISMRRQIV